jgi:hypothetical protein
MGYPWAMAHPAFSCLPIVYVSASSRCPPSAPPWMELPQSPPCCILRGTYPHSLSNCNLHQMNMVILPLLFPKPASPQPLQTPPPLICPSDPTSSLQQSNHDCEGEKTALGLISSPVPSKTLIPTMGSAWVSGEEGDDWTHNTAVEGARLPPLLLPFVHGPRRRLQFLHHNITNHHTCTGGWRVSSPTTT